MVTNAASVLYETFIGKKRTCDGLWSKYLPPEVQARTVRGPGYGSGIQEFISEVWKNALSQHDAEGLLYVIVSRMHQKWYVGMVEKWRKVAGRTDELPAGVERQSEHYEGMADPKAPRLGSGAKYTLWKPYELWDQCMFPVHRDTIPRIEKLEQYVIATDQPPANRRGKRMREEKDPWREEFRKRLQQQRPPRWQRK